MQFEWDSAKSETNLSERGFDFAFAARIFEGRTVEADDQREDYGERRIIAVGVIDGVTLTLVYTDRTSGADTVRRIISARKSNRHEKARYRNGL